MLRTTRLAYATISIALFACGDDAAPSVTNDAGSTASAGGASAGGSDATSTSASGGGGTYGPGDHDLVLEVDGYEQSYRLRVPPDIGPEAPVVVQLHGAGGSIDDMVKVTGLPALADTEGFVVVTPFGFSPNGELGLWNAGFCCGASDVDHVGILSQLVDEVVELVPQADASRVYFAGQSNGAMMAYRMACQAPEKVRGVIASAGFLANLDPASDPPAELFSCAGYTPVSILAIHGLDDPLVAYEGSAQTPPIEASVAAWRGMNDCPETGSDSTEGDVRRRAWSCSAGTTVELITVADHGHPWPGAPAETVSPMEGPTTDQLSATAELGRFVDATR